MFIDRYDAGEKLSRELKQFENDNPLILAVPRGGVVVAFDAVKRFGWQWDMVIPRKIGDPHNKEVAIGAVSYDGSYFIDETVVSLLLIPKSYIEKEAARELAEIRRRMKKYRGREAFPDVKGRTVIIIDDGIATGFTIMSAVRTIKRQGARKVIVATPVAPRDTIRQLEKEADQVVCLQSPHEFYAVGAFYEDFGEVSDEEVKKITTELKNLS